MPMAYVLLTTESGAVKNVIESLKKMDCVTETFMVYGVYDIIATVKAETMDKLREIVTAVGLTVRTAPQRLDAEVTGGYASDLLSCVLAKAQQGNLWVTLQAHPNIVAVASLLDLAGIRVPGYMQGQSLEPILKSAAHPGRSSWLYEHFPVFPIPIPGMTAVRTASHKYVEYREDIRPKQLFDLKNDPKEKRNIYGTPEGEKLEKGLKEELENLKRTTGYRYHTHG